MRLSITGTMPHFKHAIVNVRKIREEHLHGRYDLKIIDISQRSTLVEGR